MTAINATLQSFFTDRLTRQKDASSHTIAAYRDTLRLLLVFAAATHKVAASSLQWDQLDTPEITAFLDHLQKDRGNSAQTRNARLSAIHSLFRYASLHHPEHAASIARVLAIPPQRVDRHLVDYLDDHECEALLAAPDRSTWTGRRDYTFLLVAIQTGLRVSELIGLTISDVHLGAGAHLSCRGKGRKDRITPLTANTVSKLRDWEREQTPTGITMLFLPAPASSSAATRSSTESRSTPAPLLAVVRVGHDPVWWTPHKRECSLWQASVGLDEPLARRVIPSQRSHLLGYSGVRVSADWCVENKSG